MFNVEMKKVKVRRTIKVIWARELIDMIIQTLKKFVSKRGPKIINLAASW